MYSGPFCKAILAKGNAKLNMVWRYWISNNAIDCLVIKSLPQQDKGHMPSTL